MACTRIMMADEAQVFVTNDEILATGTGWAAVSPEEAAKLHHGKVIGKLKVGDRITIRPNPTKRMRDVIDGIVAGITFVPEWE